MQSPRNGMSDGLPRRPEEEKCMWPEKSSCWRTKAADTPALHTRIMNFPSGAWYTSSEPAFNQTKHPLRTSSCSSMWLLLFFHVLHLHLFSIASFVVCHSSVLLTSSWSRECWGFGHASLIFSEREKCCMIVIRFVKKIFAYTSLCKNFCVGSATPPTFHNTA